MKPSKLSSVVAGGAAALCLGLGMPAAFASMTTTPEDGGTWTRGETQSQSGHECFSYYYHPVNRHGAYANINPAGALWLYSDPGTWVYNTRWGGTYDLCYTGFNPSA